MMDTEEAVAALRRCRTPGAARDLAVHFTAAQINALKAHFGIRVGGDWSQILEAIIMCACGDDFWIRIDQWRLVHV